MQPFVVYMENVCMIDYIYLNDPIHTIILTSSLFNFANAKVTIRGGGP